MCDIVECFYYLLEDEFLKITILIINGKLDRVTKLNRTHATVTHHYESKNEHQQSGKRYLQH